MQQVERYVHLVNSSIVVLLTCRRKTAGAPVATFETLNDWILMYPRPGTRPPRRPKAPTSPVPDWSKLSRGDLVHVGSRDGTTLSGVIDMVALDRSVFWIIQEGGQGRVLVSEADNPRVTVLSAGIREES